MNSPEWNLRLAGQGIKYVRIQWVDLSNTVRFRVIPASEFARLCKSPRPNIHVTARTLGMVGINFAKRFDDTSKHWYVFDLDSFLLSLDETPYVLTTSYGWYEYDFNDDQDIAK